MCMRVMYIEIIRSGLAVYRKQIFYHEETRRLDTKNVFGRLVVFLESKTFYIFVSYRTSLCT